MLRFLGGNRLTLLRNGTEFFPALEAAIDAARHSIYLESYIFANDDTGRRIGAALSRAAQRGVSTHLVIDGFGAQDFIADGLSALHDAGVQALVFRPTITPWRFPRQHLRRLHRKLAVIDRDCAFVGGINIVDDCRVPGAGPQYDYAVRLEGPLIESIRREMQNLYRRLTRAQLGEPRRHEPEEPPPAPKGNVRAAFVRRTSLRHRRDIERAYLRAIGKARQEILLANAYFLPGRRFRRALLHAAARGVRIRLLLQGRFEYRFVHYASRALYGQLLAAGIEIHEYQTSILHAKVAVIDRGWATVGSSNIDPTSLFLAREANLVIDDPAFAGTLQDSLEHALQHDARPVSLDELRRGNWAVRALHWFAYGLVRLLAGWVGYGDQLE